MNMTGYTTVVYPQELIEEENGILRDAMVGIEYLQKMPDLMATL